MISDPRFLAKGILADLFKADDNTKAMRKDGIVKHRDVVHIWAKFRKEKSSIGEFESLAKTFMTLLQKMGVCFVVSEDEKNRSWSRGASFLPALLPMNH